jgi:hypothetical protein
VQKVLFKFKNNTSQIHRQGIIQKLSEKRILNVKRLFPTENDEDLSSLFSAEIVDEKQLDKTINYLKRLKGIEFAEREAQRKLIV